MSERDFVGQYVLPYLKQAAADLDMLDELDFHIEQAYKGVGITDLTIARGGKNLLVIEAKFKKRDASGRERDIDPRDPDVTRQAVDYASNEGFTYYATCNVNRIVLFQMRAGYKPNQNEIDSIDYAKNQAWATNVLKAVLGLVPIRLKEIGDSLVSTLKEAYVDLYPELYQSLRSKLKDSKFKKAYEKWLQAQGLEYNDETNLKVSREIAYLQLNKLVFYKVIQLAYPKELDPLEIPEGEEDVSSVLQSLYSKVLHKDYKAVYQKTEILSEIPLTRRSQLRLITLIDALNQYDFEAFDTDIIGSVYEKLIPIDERKELGQFYTPPQITNLITDLLVTDKDDVILDPSCGSGTFLISAYKRLMRLNGMKRNVEGGLSDSFHQQILDQIYGIDINQFPAHLSVINLALQNPRVKSDRTNITVKDFFDVSPKNTLLSGFESIDVDDQSKEITIPAHVDVVVANPPYIRQELLGEFEKEKIEAIIGSDTAGKVTVGSGTEGSKEAIHLNRQSDIYVYFYAHALHFLKNGGRLGFITSNKWLEVEYGEPFQDFLLRYTKVECIIEFDSAVFPDAEVNTEITIVEKAEGKALSKDRENNTVKFIRIKKPISSQELRKVIEDVDEIDNDSLRVTSIKQGLLGSGKWNKYLRAPPVFFKLLRNTSLVPLGEVCEIFRGATTGYNDYFILDEHDAKDKKDGWDIEDEFLKPVLSSPKSLKGLILKRRDIHEFYFACDKPRDELKGTHALEYIKYGDKKTVDVSRGSDKGNRPLSELETLRTRALWYSIPQFPTPDIMIQKFFDQTTRAILNEANAQANDLFYYCIARKKEDSYVIAGYLNSTIASLLFELYGRSYGGGVLDLKVYEVKQIPVIDPSAVNTSVSDRFHDLIKELHEAQLNVNKSEEDFRAKRSKKPKQKGIFEDEADQELQRAKNVLADAQRSLDFQVLKQLGYDKDQSKNLLKKIEEEVILSREMRRTRTESRGIIHDASSAQREPSVD